MYSEGVAHPWGSSNQQVDPLPLPSYISLSVEWSRHVSLSYFQSLMVGFLLRSKSRVRDTTFVLVHLLARPLPSFYSTLKECYMKPPI